MKYAIVDPARRTVEVVNVADARDAYCSAGLDPDHVDHGTVYRGLGIVVGEFGLFDMPDTQHYFSIDRRLYAGNAVLYAWNERGITKDYEFAGRWFGTWYADFMAVEQAITLGRIERPQMSINSEVFWQWPGPRPVDAMKRAAEQIAKHPGRTIIDGDTIIEVKK